MTIDVSVADAPTAEAHTLVACGAARCLAARLTPAVRSRPRLAFTWIHTVTATDLLVVAPEDTPGANCSNPDGAFKESCSDLGGASAQLNLL